VEVEDWEEFADEGVAGVTKLFVDKELPGVEADKVFVLAHVCDGLR
jgi:hypothetical protein